MKSGKLAKQYTPKFKFQMIVEGLQGEKTMGRIAKTYGVHPVSLTHWETTEWAFTESAECARRTMIMHGHIITERNERLMAAHNAPAHKKAWAASSSFR